MKIALMNNNVYVIIINIYIIKVNIAKVFNEVIIEIIFIKSFKIQLSIFNKFKNFLILNS